MQRSSLSRYSPRSRLANQAYPVIKWPVTSLVRPFVTLGRTILRKFPREPNLDVYSCICISRYYCIAHMLALQRISLCVVDSFERRAADGRCLQAGAVSLSLGMQRFQRIRTHGRRASLRRRGIEYN